MLNIGINWTRTPERQLQVWPAPNRERRDYRTP